jgi:GNAT superfamily N-acetyltransferase
MAVASDVWDASIVIVSGGLSIRVAGPGDAGLLAQLNGIVQGPHYDAHPDRFLPPDPQRVEPLFRAWPTSGHERAWLPGRSETKGWLCEDEQGEAIGYVVAVYRERPESPFTRATRWVELDQVAVREDARGKGAGRLRFVRGPHQQASSPRGRYGAWRSSRITAARGSAPRT